MKLPRSSTVNGARSFIGDPLSSVIAGLVPAIHLLREMLLAKGMDPRVKPAGDPCGCMLLRLDVGELDHLGPALGILANERSERFGAVAGGIEPLRLHALLLELPIADHADEAGIELVDDVARRAGRRHDAPPGPCVHLRKALLRERRH